MIIFKSLSFIVIPQLITFVATSLSLPPATTPNAIVSGAECDNTNLLLQQLAILIHLHSTHNSNPQWREETAINEEDAPLRDVDCWVTAVKILFSVDGTTWDDGRYQRGRGSVQGSIASAKVYKTELTSPTDSKSIVLSEGAVEALYVKIIPMEWQCHSRGNSGSGEVTTHRRVGAPADYGPAVRLQLNVLPPKKRSSQNGTTNSVDGKKCNYSCSLSLGCNMRYFVLVVLIFISFS